MPACAAPARLVGEIDDRIQVNEWADRMFASGRRLKHKRRGGLRAVERISLAVAGGYGFTVLAVMLLARLLSALMPRSEAVVLSAMLGFTVYLVVLLWAFSERRPFRLWLVLGGGSLAAFAVLRLAGGLDG